MTRIAYLVTSAREVRLADGTPHPTGYFAEEAQLRAIGFTI
jgi:hypothetical protein